MTVQDIRVSQLVEKIKSFGNLPVGWDTYSGKPATPRAVQTATQLLINGNLDLSGINVVPGSDGSIQFEWHHGPTSVELRVDRSGMWDISVRTTPPSIGEELAEAQRHAKVLGKACVGLMNNGKPDCKDHELRNSLIYVKGFPS